MTHIAATAIWIRIIRWGQGYNYDVRDAGGLFQTANPVCRANRWPA